MGDKIKLIPSQIKALAERRNSPNIIKPESCLVCYLSKTLIDNVILYLIK